tara:strand:- start:55 stop:306 length:252 start_codon:yes stop_codon:yes gene_type:complete
MIDTILSLMAIGISGYTLWVIKKIEKDKLPNYKDIICRYPDTNQQKAFIELEFNKAKELEKEIDRLKELETDLLRKKLENKSD